jgi:hypothetical protein
MSEQWRDILGFEGYYAVSNHGRIKRVKDGPGTRAGRILKTQNQPNRYPLVSLKCDGSKRMVYVHQVAAEAWIGPRPKGKVVNHKNGNKEDNRIENLEYCSPRENVDHAVKTGLTPRGEKNGKAKLTPDQVIAIRSTKGVSQVKLAKQYGVSKRMVGRIQHGVNWSHL